MSDCHRERERERLLIIIINVFHSETEEQTTPAAPRLHYDIEVKLVNLGDGFVAPAPESPDFEIISNTVSESFGPVLEKLPGYYQIRLDELQK